LETKRRSCRVCYSSRNDERREGPREQAYARLFDGALDGDQRLFARADGVEEAWRIVAPALADHTAVTLYEPGSWGPAGADALVARDGGWHCPMVAAAE
jgi:glucose-6-phosphate 1-dehydrogenase